MLRSESGGWKVNGCTCRACECPTYVSGEPRVCMLCRKGSHVKPGKPVPWP